MSKFVAILLLTLFLTYHLGYYGFYLLVKYRIENNFPQVNVAPTNTLSLPLMVNFNLPYWLNHSYQFNSKPVRIDRQFFRLIKLQVSHDSLHFTLIPDYQSEHLHHVLKEWAATFTSIPVSDNGDIEWWKFMGKDFIYPSGTILHILGKSQCYFSFVKLIHYPLFINVPAPPP